VPRRVNSAWSRPDLAYAVFVINAVVIVGFWWFSSGFEITRNASDFFNGVGRATGLLGTYLVLWQLLFMARVPWLEHAFGLERMAVLHKWNGYLAIGLLVGHAVFQTLGYQLGDGKDVASQLADFITSYQGLLAAIVALGLFVAVVVLSVAVARRHFAYETWYFIHLYAYLAVVLAFSHQLATGVDFAGNPAFVWYGTAQFLPWYFVLWIVEGMNSLSRFLTTSLASLSQPCAANSAPYATSKPANTANLNATSREAIKTTRTTRRKFSATERRRTSYTATPARWTSHPT